MGDTALTIPSAETGHIENAAQQHSTTDAERAVKEDNLPVNQETTPSSLGSNVPTQHAFSSQLDLAASRQPQNQQGPYNMASMSNALPVANIRQGQHYQNVPPSRHAHHSSPPTIQQIQQIQQMQQMYHMQHMQHMPQMPQYGGQPQMPMGSHGYYVQQPPPMPQYYNPGQVSPTQSQGGMATGQNAGYYPPPIMMNQSQTYYYPQSPHYHGQQQHQSSPHTTMNEQHITGMPQPVDNRSLSRYKTDANSTVQKHHRKGQEDYRGRPNAVRGPPRKPKQSGHAIWIGNLPPQTDLMSLVKHVCKEAPGLESLFLISKSNCAFANFADENISLAAQQKLHESKFQSVRLVSRLRKSAVEASNGVSALTGPAAEESTASTTDIQENRAAATDGDTSITILSSTNLADAKKVVVSDESTQQDRFFILKSLTIEDLDISVQTGIWATQSHNEETLSSAFKNSDNVYLIFSANKSGEYFGYARMISEINTDPAAAVEFAPKIPTTSDFDLPKAIPTEATEHIPKGRIIDDSTRGTIFWEAEREDSECGSDDESDDLHSRKSTAEEEEAKTWGKPFKLKWLSTNRLPFYRTRGLRNPWNSNREVKIARDGTELEPAAGRKLIGLFNRAPNPGSIPSAMRHATGMMPGYPPMMPYGQ